MGACGARCSSQCGGCSGCLWGQVQEVLAQLEPEVGACGGRCKRCWPTWRSAACCPPWWCCRRWPGTPTSPCRWSRATSSASSRRYALQLVAGDRDVGHRAAGCRAMPLSHPRARQSPPSCRHGAVRQFRAWLCDGRVSGVMPIPEGQTSCLPQLRLAEGRHALLKPWNTVDGTCTCACPLKLVSATQWSLCPACDRRLQASLCRAAGKIDADKAAIARFQSETPVHEGRGQCAAYAGKPLMKPGWMPAGHWPAACWP